MFEWHRTGLNIFKSYEHTDKIMVLANKQQDEHEKLYCIHQLGRLR